MNFRAIQSQINVLANKIANIQDAIVITIRDRERITGETLGPAGNRFDKEEYYRLTKRICQLTDDAEDMQRQINELRLQLQAASVVAA